MRLFKLAADALAPFGTGRGGMSVEVVMRDGACRSWRLLAEDGDGPFIPAVAARALLRRKVLPTGARSALGVVTLDEAEAARADLHVRVERGGDRRVPVVRQALGPVFDALPPELRAAHATYGVHRFRGEARVPRGHGLWERFLAAVFGFPRAADLVEVEVVKTATAEGEIWERRFGQSLFRSVLSHGAEGMTEAFGPFRFAIGLHAAAGAVHFPVTGGRVGPVPLPRWLLPVSETREEPRDGRFAFDVTLRAPVTRRLIVRYEGWLEA